MITLPSQNKMLFAIGVIILCIVFEGAFIYGAYKWGSAACKQEQAETVIKKQDDNRKGDAKIDRITPYGADKRSMVEWLRHHTVD